ncbi:MAG: hypothetical protein AB7F59_03140 [Bdellovibrionales bacterium]
MRTVFNRSLTILFLGLTGCVSLHSYIPAMQMESPETNGKWLKARLHFAAASTADITVVDDASYRPLTFHSPTPTTQRVEYYLSGSMGVIERLDIGLKAGLLHSPNVLFMKYQFLGAPLREAKEGNQSLTVMVGGGTYYSIKDGDQNGVFGRGGYKWNGKLLTHSREGQLIYGYRGSDTTLFYGGPFYADYRAVGDVYHERSDDGLSPAMSYRFERQGTRTGVNGNVELRLGTKALAFFNLGVGYSKFTFTDAPDSYGWDVGTNLNFGL